MVKFGRQLQTEIVTEWEEFYLDYKGLRKILKRQKAARSKNVLATISTQLATGPLPSVQEAVDTVSHVLSMHDDDGEELIPPEKLNYKHKSNLDPNDLINPDEKTPLIVVQEHSHGPDESDGDDYELMFLEYVRAQLDKINVFYTHKMKDYWDTFATIKEKEIHLSYRNDEKGLYHIRTSFVELYRHINLLESYSILNYTGFSKILKKHDKQSDVKLKKDFFKSNIAVAEFADTKDLKHLLEEVAQFFANVYEEGDIIRARSTLLLRREEKGSHRDSLIFGLAIGLIIPLFAWNIYQFVKVMMHLDDKNKTYFLALMPIYYCIGLICLLVWVIGFQIMIWTKHRINYCYIFEINPRTRMTYHQVLTEAANTTVVFLFSLLLYLLDNNSNFRPRSQLYPVILMIFILVKLINPFKTGYFETRRFCWGVLFNVVIAPFGRIRFVDFFVADVLTSMVKVFTELSSVVCFYVTGNFIHLSSTMQCQQLDWIKPAITALPLWFRFMQCLRRYHNSKNRSANLPNAFKYALSLIVVCFASFHPLYNKNDGEWSAFRILWLISFAFSTLYTFYWDIFMDWDLGQLKAKPFFLRNNRLFTRPWVYYLAILMDGVLRFVWTLTLLPNTINPFWTTGSYVGRTLITPIFGALELIRRGMWGCFRLEAEHLGGGPDSYREISSIPLKFNTETDNLDVDREAEISSKKTTLIEVGAIFVAVICIAIGTYFVDR